MLRRYNSSPHVIGNVKVKFILAFTYLTRLALKTALVGIFLPYFHQHLPLVSFFLLMEKQ
jgi:hypothetical protein